MAELARLPDPLLVAVRCPDSLLEIIGLSAGLEFPRQANRYSETGSATVLWTGPDDWLVVADAEDAPRLIPALEAACAGHHAAVVDISGNRAHFRLSGDGAREMMARACSLDLDPPHFGVGHCAGTLIARTHAFILQRTDAPSYELFVRRSYARYLAEWFAASDRAGSPA